MMSTSGPQGAAKALEKRLDHVVGVVALHGHVEGRSQRGGERLEEVRHELRRQLADDPKRLSRAAVPGDRDAYHVSVSLFDARPADRDVSSDARTLALNLGSIRLLERLSAWRPGGAGLWPLRRSL